MSVAAVLCLAAGVAIAGAGLWQLSRPRSEDRVRQVLRSVAPVQLAAAVMLAAGGVVAATTTGGTARTAVVVSVIGAVGTLAAGCWQGAKAVARHAAGATDACGGACATCTLSCSGAEASSG